MGAIVIGGMPSFAPQTSADVQLAQNVFSAQWDMTQSRRSHLLKAGVLIEHYREDLYNPTFSLGIYRFTNLAAYLQNAAASFVGLTPDAELDRQWRFTQLGFYAQDEYQLTRRLVVNGGLRYEPGTVPVEKAGRDVTLIRLTDAQPTRGPLFRNPTFKSISPRVGVTWYREPAVEGDVVLRSWADVSTWVDRLSGLVRDAGLRASPPASLTRRSPSVPRRFHAAWQRHGHHEP